MGGVGSFNRQNRTLYIGRIKETRQTAEDVEDHFSEFGEIERSEFICSLHSLKGKKRELISVPGGKQSRFCRIEELRSLHMSRSSMHNSQKKQ